jgi:hypothetical protein
MKKKAAEKLAAKAAPVETPTESNEAVVPVQAEVETVEAEVPASVETNATETLETPPEAAAE